MTKKTDLGVSFQLGGCIYDGCSEPGQILHDQTPVCLQHDAAARVAMGLPPCFHSWSDVEDGSGRACCHFCSAVRYPVSEQKTSAVDVGSALKTANFVSGVNPQRYCDYEVDDWPCADYANKKDHDGRWLCDHHWLEAMQAINATPKGEIAEKIAQRAPKIVGPTSRKVRLPQDE